MMILLWRREAYVSLIFLNDTVIGRLIQYFDSYWLWDEFAWMSNVIKIYVDQNQYKNE